VVVGTLEESVYGELDYARRMYRNGIIIGNGILCCGLKQKALGLF